MPTGHGVRMGSVTRQCVWPFWRTRGRSDASFVTHCVWLVRGHVTSDKHVLHAAGRQLYYRVPQGCGISGSTWQQHLAQLAHLARYGEQLCAGPLSRDNYGTPEYSFALHAFVIMHEDTVYSMAGARYITKCTVAALSFTTPAPASRAQAP